MAKQQSVEEMMDQLGKSLAKSLTKTLAKADDADGNQATNKAKSSDKDDDDDDDNDDDDDDFNFDDDDDDDDRGTMRTRKSAQDEEEQDDLKMRKMLKRLAKSTAAQNDSLGLLTEAVNKAIDRIQALEAGSAVRKSLDGQDHESLLKAESGSRKNNGGDSAKQSDGVFGGVVRQVLSGKSVTMRG